MIYGKNMLKIISLIKPKNNLIYAYKEDKIVFYKTIDIETIHKLEQKLNLSNINNSSFCTKEICDNKNSDISFLNIHFFYNTITFSYELGYNLRTSFLEDIKYILKNNRDLLYNYMFGKISLNTIFNEILLYKSDNYLSLNKLTNFAIDLMINGIHTAYSQLMKIANKK